MDPLFDAVFSKENIEIYFIPFENRGLFLYIRVVVACPNFPQVHLNNRCLQLLLDSPARLLQKTDNL